ncbi:shikimate kinase [Gimibacter soli]|uniref:Shikimate kinase n=2 Tax=Gimibacter soli TaxID=3024400 RepID=A0AAE9XPU6_9PROT|nr:shikimate kinase [Gimibacter soli]WCL54176.1 shikimate kinase [Gimibacter soli]
MMTKRPARKAARGKAGAMPPIDRSIVLVGLMGAGKTTVGRRLARKLGLSFVDSDHEIEEAAGMSIAEIFETYGEAEFRAVERRVIARLMDGKPKILATGGGAFINGETRALIQETAISVWLDADVNVLVERTGRRNTRPLLKGGDPREILARLAAERSPIYAEAQLRVVSGDGPHDDVVTRVIEALTNRAAPKETARA